MKLLNALEAHAPDGSDGDTAALCEGMSVLLRALYPACPHIHHALWSALGYARAVGDLLDAPWPQVDEAALVQDEIELVLQVGGKLRGAIRVPAGADKAAIEAAALAAPEFARFGEGKPARKVVVVPGAWSTWWSESMKNGACSSPHRRPVAGDARRRIAAGRLRLRAAPGTALPYARHGADGLRTWLAAGRRVAAQPARRHHRGGRPRRRPRWCCRRCSTARAQRGGRHRGRAGARVAIARAPSVPTAQPGRARAHRRPPTLLQSRDMTYSETVAPWPSSRRRASFTRPCSPTSCCRCCAGWPSSR
jgi:hypothetical protein